MKRLFVSLIALAAVAATYVWTFGPPPQLIQALPFLATATGETAEAATNRPRNPGRNARSMSVVLQPLEVRPYNATIQTLGSAKSWRNSEITAETSGRVTEVLWDSNRRVDAGEVLVRLDDRTARLNLDLTRAELAQAESVRDRYIRLRGSGSATVTDVMMTDAELAVTRAESAVGLAELALDERTIRAPFAGRLGLSEIEVGDLVAESDVIVTIDDSETLLVEFDLPERAISMLALGRTVLASTPSYAGRVFEAEVTAYDSRLDSATRSVSVQARIDNADGLLWSGMTFVVRLLNDSEPMAVVPATALNWARHGAGVWVVSDGKAARHPVTVRFRQGGNVWIDTDLPQGTTIVTEGGLKLREGSLVKEVPSSLDSDAPLQALSPTGNGGGDADATSVSMTQPADALPTEQEDPA